MANSDYMGPSAGYHAPPDPAAGPRGPYDYPPQSQHYDDFDPQTGQPLPQGYVPPPHYDYQHGPRPAEPEYERGAYDGNPPSEAGTRRGGYAASDVRPTEDNALAPWDEDKADAEWRRGYDEDRRRYQRAPPPASAYDDRYEDERYDDRADPRYDSAAPPHTAASPDSYYDYRDRRRSDRRQQDSRKSPPQRKRDILRSNESDSGLGAQLLGGAAGAFAGHEFGGGLLETIGGAFIGAVGAKVIEKQMEKRKSRRSGGDDDRRDPPPSSSYDRADSRGRYPSTSVASRAPARRSRSRSVRGARSRSTPRSPSSRSWSGGRSPPRRR